MELSELIGQAQTMMDDGAYTRASVVCEHGLEHYPACLTLQRMLGECLLEQRFVDKAIERFQAALNVDPLSVLGRLGMGVAAEEKQDFEAAYACYLHAWEINPALQHVRDRLVKLRQMLGVDPRLHLTRAGLASVHLRAGQYDRAIAELRALADADPDARRIRAMLAEAHWRKGDDAAAAGLCREGLEHSPENARYLGLLAEIELRLSSPTAADIVARYQAADPMGEIASLMMEWRADRDVSHLFRESAPLPEPAAAPAEIEQPVTLVMEAAKIAVPEFTDAASSREPALAYSGGKVTAGLDKSIQPFVWDESAPGGSGGSDGGWDDWSNPAPRVTNSLPESSVATNGGSSSASSSPSPFVTADGRLDLTVGWDDLDKALAEATPQTGPLSNYTGLLSQLSVEGIAPFDASEVKGDESAWEPLFEPDGGTGLLGGPLVPSAAPAPVQPVPVQPAPARVEASPAQETWPMPAQAAQATPTQPAPAPAATPAEEDEIAPFSFEDRDTSYSDRGFPAHAFDDPSADLGDSPRPQTGSLLQKPVEAMASALDAMFSDDDAMEPRTTDSGPRPVERPSSVFDMLRASKSRPAPMEQQAPAATAEPGVASEAEPVAAVEAPALATRFDDLPMTAILPAEAVDWDEDQAGEETQAEAAVVEPTSVDSLEAVAAEMRAAMAQVDGAGPRSGTHVETSELEAWVQANAVGQFAVQPEPTAEPARIEPVAEAAVEAETVVAAVAIDPVVAAVEVGVDAEFEGESPVAAAESVEVDMTGVAADDWFAAGDDVAESAAAESPEVGAAEASAQEPATDEATEKVIAAEPVAVSEAEAVATETETAEEAGPVEVVALPVADADACAAEVVEMAAAPEAEPVAEEQPEMFHVEPVSAPMTRSRRAVSLDVAELRSLRARLAAEEHGAADVLMTVQTRLAGRAPDRDLARLLGEAHLRLGQHGAAAAHFRQAMLHGVRERTENLASQPR